jgi:isopenicillin-N epimerase
LGNASGNSESSDVVRSWSAIARDDFLLEPGSIYLNAGTFSALPRRVAEALFATIRYAEGNPTRIAAGNRREPWDRIRHRLATYAGADADGFVFHFNVTQALNQALFCHPWPKRGEFLSSDMEYGAIVNAAQAMCKRYNLEFRTFPLPTAPKTPDEIIESVLRAVSRKTVGVLLSHVISWNGLVVPIREIASELRRKSIRLIVDGAHGPGLLNLDLTASEIDYYGGNLHKWFMGPKGTGFLYASPEVRQTMRPHIVGWGGVPHDPASTLNARKDTGIASDFPRVFSIQGLLDASPFLALEETLRYREAIGGESRIRTRIARLCEFTRERIRSATGLSPLSPSPPLQAGLVTFRLPESIDPESMRETLFQRHRITVGAWPTTTFPILRVSPHVWNRKSDIETLADALADLITPKKGTRQRR